MLPRIGYGRTKVGGGGGAGGGSGAKINNIEFSVLSQTFADSELIVEYELKLLHGKKTAEYTILVDSEGGLIDPNTWTCDIGTEFPIEILQVDVKSLSSSVESEKYFDDIICDRQVSDSANDYVRLSLCNESGAGVGFKITSEISSPVIRGTMKLITTDKKYRMAYKIL